MSAADHEFMARALQLAARGLYSAHPNPRVGCVIVRDGEIVGEGWHARTGGPHAEVVALQQAGGRARGATAYVTLEPCCHTGRTPPCTDALLQAGVARVVAAMLDPNPQVAGNGMAQLAQAGVHAESGVLQAQAEALNRGFITRMEKKRPFVRCKLAMSLDGRTALANGASRWITGDAARLDVQRLRAQSGAILTGVGTVLIDDPSLTVRAAELAAQGVELNTDPSASSGQVFAQPLRVVLDSQLRTPEYARLLAAPGRALIVTAATDAARKERLLQKGAEIIAFPDQAQKVDVRAALHYLAARHEINDVLLEAGPTLSGAMLEAGLVDELVIYIAPVLLGDAARGLFHLSHTLQTMQERITLKVTEVRAVGRDWRVTVKPDVP
ncbi:MAG: bifunctional diaminohydroxyphosphoribosylaminopyrimidine deaminase/5-amino-6-(5-phosphoribosylamino)uracil reductase RibD [Pseudomonadota bacterium]